MFHSLTHVAKETMTDSRLQLHGEAIFYGSSLSRPRASVSKKKGQFWYLIHGETHRLGGWKLVFH